MMGQTQDIEATKKRIREKAKNDSEIRVNEFLFDLGLKFIDCNVHIMSDGAEIGEIDGLFEFDDCLIIVEVRKQTELESREISDFFTKWSDIQNLRKVLSTCGLTRRRVIRVFFKLHNY